MKRNEQLSAIVMIGASLLAGCDNADDDNRLVGQLESDRIELTAYQSATTGNLRESNRKRDPRQYEPRDREKDHDQRQADGQPPHERYLNVEMV